MLRSALIVAALVAALTFVAVPGTASAAKPCWRTVINDWYDGHIDHAYPVHCLRDVLANAPSELKIYSDLPEDVNRALQSALTKRAVDGVRHTTIHPFPGRQARGPIGRVLSQLGPSRADSLPVPLLVLGALALLLIAAGAVGMATRRLAARRIRPGPPS